MKIYELLDELKEELEHSPKTVFSNKRTVDVDIFLEIVADIRAAIPQELQEAEKIILEKDKLIAEAKEEAAGIISSADDELQTRVSESQVVQEAEVKAKELMAKAESNAREITIGAKEYADDILREIEVYFGDYLKVIRKNRLELTGKRKS